MPRPQLILPRPDPACGKVFYGDRRTADGHRIALEVWNQATGRSRVGYRLAVYRCRRCGGFHIAQRSIVSIQQTAKPPIAPASETPPREHEYGLPRVRRVSCCAAYR